MKTENIEVLGSSTVPVYLNSTWHRPSRGSTAVPTHSAVRQVLAPTAPASTTQTTQCTMLLKHFITNIDAQMTRGIGEGRPPRLFCKPVNSYRNILISSTATLLLLSEFFNYQFFVNHNYNNRRTCFLQSPFSGTIPVRRTR